MIYISVSQPVLKIKTWGSHRLIGIKFQVSYPPHIKKYIFSTSRWMRAKPLGINDEVMTLSFAIRSRGVWEGFFSLAEKISKDTWICYKLTHENDEVRSELRISVKKKGEVNFKSVDSEIRTWYLWRKMKLFNLEWNHNWVRISWKVLLVFSMK